MDMHKKLEVATKLANSPFESDRHAALRLVIEVLAALVPHATTTAASPKAPEGSSNAT